MAGQEKRSTTAPHSPIQQPASTGTQESAETASPSPRKRQRVEPAPHRTATFVVGQFRPSDLKDIRNAKRRLAKPQTHDALAHKELIYLHRRLRAYRGLRKEMWKVARGTLKPPAQRGWVPSPESLAVKGALEHAPPVEDLREEWPRRFSKLDKQHIIARPSERARQTISWERIQGYTSENPETPNPVRFVIASLQHMSGLAGTPAEQEEEGSNAAAEPPPAAASPSRSRGGRGAEDAADLTLLPAARATAEARAGNTVASPHKAPPLATPRVPTTEPTAEGLPPPHMAVATHSLASLADLTEGWESMATRSLWWTLSAAQDYRTAREAFEYHLEELGVSSARGASGASIRVLAHERGALGDPYERRAGVSARVPRGRTQGGERSLRTVLAAVPQVRLGLAATTVPGAQPSPSQTARPAPAEPRDEPQRALSPTPVTVTSEEPSVIPPRPLPALRPELSRAPPPLPRVRSQPLGLDGVGQESSVESGPAAADSQTEQSSDEPGMAGELASKRSRTRGR
ncbi:hypothetical protein Emed_004350 [Eimeria media]